MIPVIRTAIVRPPGASFAQGLTQSRLGAPELGLALRQHAAYAAALERAGARVVRLEPDAAFPDSTFVEDTAVIVGPDAILTRPGAPSRRGETETMRSVLRPLVRVLDEIDAPGTVDGGDVLEVGDRYLIGISERTNEDGARLLAERLASKGRPARCVDLREMPEMLHLKTGIAWLGGDWVVAVAALAEIARSLGLEALVVEPEEAYAANCIRVNDRVLLPAGSPALERALETWGETRGETRGCIVERLEMSEFQKMDGGLSCLSLRLE